MASFDITCALSESKLFNTLMVFLKEYCERNSIQQKKKTYQNLKNTSDTGKWLSQGHWGHVDVVSK